MNQKPETVICPICKQNDRISLIGDPDQADRLPEDLLPPEPPETPAALTVGSEGLGCVGAVFFGAAFFLSVAFGSLIASIIFGLFLLFFGAAFLVVYMKRQKARRGFEAQYAVWQAKMDVWNRLLYCSRDGVVFDPESGRYAPIERAEDLYNEAKP